MSQPGFAGKRRIVDIPGSGGNFQALLATTACRRVVIEESPITAEGAPNALQGLIDYQIPNDSTTNGFTTVFRAAGANSDAAGANQVDVAKITLGNPIAQHQYGGELLGNGPNVIGGGVPATPATTLCNLRSGTVAGTSVVVTEYN